MDSEVDQWSVGTNLVGNRATDVVLDLRGRQIGSWPDVLALVSKKIGAEFVDRHEAMARSWQAVFLQSNQFCLYINFTICLFYIVVVLRNVI